MPSYIIGKQPAEVKFYFNSDTEKFSYVNENSVEFPIYTGVMREENIELGEGNNNLELNAGVRYNIDGPRGGNLIFSNIDNSSIEIEVLLFLSDVSYYSISFPDNINFVEGSDLSFAPGNRYLINIKNSIAVVNKVI